MRIIRRKIISGQRRGRLLGFPTMNLRYERKDKIRFGVWAVKSRLGHEILPGVAHVGAPLSFGKSRPVIEIHLLDFSGNGYGKRIKVEFLKFLRRTKKFKNEKAFVTQIKKDCQKANRYFEVMKR